MQRLLMRHRVLVEKAEAAVAALQEQQPAAAASVPGAASSSSKQQKQQPPPSCASFFWLSGSNVTCHMSNVTHVTFQSQSRRKHPINSTHSKTQQRKPKSVHLINI
jgi:hypothetical protein